MTGVRSWISRHEEQRMIFKGELGLDTKECWLSYDK
jgi:hypothetical protein